MSDTPRTDDADWVWLPDDFNRTAYVAVKFARTLECELAAAQSTIAAQAKEIERLRVDAKRLDFMIEEGFYVAHASDGECCWLMWRPNEERSFVRHQLGSFADGRAAIDVARRALGDDK